MYIFTTTIIYIASVFAVLKICLPERTLSLGLKILMFHLCIIRGVLYRDSISYLSLVIIKLTTPLKILFNTEVKLHDRQPSTYHHPFLKTKRLLYSDCVRLALFFFS